MSGSVLQNWPTTIYQHDLPDADEINTVLLGEILDREPADTSKSFGVVAGRKSSPDLMTWTLPQAELLRGHITAACAAMLRLPEGKPLPPTRAHAWAVVYQPGGSHELHNHHDAAVSGVYYLAASADETDGGAIEIYDPRVALHARYPQQPPACIRIQPRPGLLIAFPAWALHRVLPVTSTQRRICVAFNVAFTQ